MTSQSPPQKKIKLESPTEADADLKAYKPEEYPVDEEELDEEHCTICLQPLSDRTLLPACSHEFCFDCILMWTEQSRKCPLCARQIGEYLIHNIRSKYDYQKHYLTPLRTSPRPDVPLVRVRATQRRRQRDVEWGRSARREREQERRAADELERAIERRRWVYRYKLYAKHVASNTYTRYRPFPTPQQFSSNPDLIRRATIFIRRELRVWESLDVEFLTTFTISLMKSLDIRSEPAVKLLAEFLDMDSEDGRSNAEHLAHELYSYLRSPYRDLAVYDSVVQYDTPEDLSPPRHLERSRRWATESPSPPPSRSPSPRPSHPRSHAETRYRSRAVSPSARGESRSRMAGSSSSRRKHRSKSRSGSRQRTIDMDPHTDKENTRRRDGNEGHVGDIKGKGRAIDVDRDMEAGTYMRSRSDDTSDPTLPRGSAVMEDKDPGRIRSGAIASVGQSAHTENNTSQTSPMGAGVVGPGGHTDSLLLDAVRKTAQDPVRPHKEERPRVGRGAWQSLNTYLANTSTAERNGHVTRSQPQPEINKAERIELSIRGAAQQRVDSAAGASPAQLNPSGRKRLDEDMRRVRTVTSIPATLARTPEVSDSYAAIKDVPPSEEVMARTRSRLTKMKEELPAEGYSEYCAAANTNTTTDIASTSSSRPKDDDDDVPINAAHSAANPPSPSNRTLALVLPMPVATAPESPRASVQEDGKSAGAASGFRARLLDKLERERRGGAHFRHQAEAHRHGDHASSSHSGLGEGFGNERAEDETRLDASVAASERRDAEILEAKLRQQARRLRMSGYGDNTTHTEAPNNTLSGMTTDGLLPSMGTDLRTREENLRTRLKRSR